MSEVPSCFTKRRGSVSDAVRGNKVNSVVIKDDSGDVLVDGERCTRSVKEPGSRATRAAKKIRRRSRIYRGRSISGLTTQVLAYLIFTLATSSLDENIPSLPEKIGSLGFPSELCVTEFCRYL